MGKPLNCQCYWCHKRETVETDDFTQEAYSRGLQSEGWGGSFSNFIYEWGLSGDEETVI